MTSERYVLDTSAVLALIEEDGGADRVESLLREHEVLLPWVVLMETYYITIRERGQAEADRRFAMLKRAAPVTWEINESLLLAAARFKASYPMSFADALIAAYALRASATLVHKDPEFKPLDVELSTEILP